MSESKELPNRICQKHPENALDDWLYHNDRGQKRFRCRWCRHEIANRYYQNNKEKVKERTKDYRERNLEKIREIRRQWWHKTKNIIKAEHAFLRNGKMLNLFRRLRIVIIEINAVKLKYEKFRRNAE